MVLSISPYQNCLSMSLLSDSGVGIRLFRTTLSPLRLFPDVYLVNTIDILLENSRIEFFGRE
jgi:hypothetical protein